MSFQRAELIWWKGDQVLVVEASIHVDENDADRAFRRARTLQAAGVQAGPLVVGDAWVDLEVLARAEARRVGWKVGDSVSDDFVAFRRAEG